MVEKAILAIVPVLSATSPICPRDPMAGRKVLLLFSWFSLTYLEMYNVIFSYWLHYFYSSSLCFIILSVMPEKSVFMLKAVAEEAIGGFSEPSRISLVTYCVGKI